MRKFKVNVKWAVFSTLLIALIITVSIFTGLWIVTEQNRNESEIRNFREMSLEAQRHKVYLEVERVLDYIKFVREEHESENEELVKNEILDHLSKIRFGYAGYVFVNRFDGQPLIFDGNRVFEKRNVSDMVDAAGKRLFDIELEAARDSAGGYMEYLFKRMDSNVEEPKLSFIKGVSDWQWIIGAGDYLNDMNEEVALKSAELNGRLRTKIYRILLVLFLFVLLAFVTAMFLSRLSSNQFAHFRKFFGMDPSESKELDTDKFFLSELAELGEQANAMVEKNKMFNRELAESTRKLEEAQKIAKVGSWTFNPRTRETNWSAEMWRLYNLSPRENPPSMEEYYEMVHPDDLEQLKFEQMKAMESTAPEDYIFRTNPKLGDVKYLLATTKTEFDKQGIALLSGTIVDVTEIQTARNELQESETRYRFLVENVSGVIWQLDADFNTVFVSPNVEKMLGYSVDEFSKLKIEDIHPASEIAKVRSAMMNRKKLEARGFHSDLPEIAEFEYLTKDEKKIQVEVHAVPIYNQLDKFAGVLMSLIDVTSQRAAEAESKRLAARNEQILSTSWDGYILTNEQGIILDVNSTYCNISGFSKEELLSMSVYDLMVEVDDIQTKERTSQIIGRGGGRYEAKHRKKDGTIVDVELSNSVASQDDLILVATFVRDITEEKEKKLKLAMDVKRLGALVALSTTLNRYLNYQQIGDAIVESVENTFGWKRASVWLLSNDKEEIHLQAHSGMGLSENDFKAEFDRIDKLVGKPGDGIAGWVALHGKPINSGSVHADVHYIPADTKINSDLCVPIALGHETIGSINVESEEYDAFSEEDEQTLTIIANQAAVAFRNTQTMNELQQELVSRSQAETELEEIKAGLEREVAERTSALEKQYEDIHQSIKAMSFMNEDILSAKNELEKVNKLLSESNKNLEDFAHMVSHDLKGPLNQISIFSQSLKEEYKDKLDAEGIELIDDMNYACKTMNQLISSILDFSRASKKRLDFVNIDMGELFNSIYHEHLKTSENKNVKFKVKNNIQCSADYVLMKQIAHNLVGNAFKFSAKTENPLIELSANELEEQIEYCVKDNGVGFNSKYAEKIFDTFTRAHSGDRFKGTGVGLSIVKKIIEKHGGKIWAEGKVGKGAKFFFTLPKAHEYKEK